MGLRVTAADPQKVSKASTGGPSKRCFVGSHQVSNWIPGSAIIFWMFGDILGYFYTLKTGSQKPSEIEKSHFFLIFGVFLSKRIGVWSYKLKNLKRLIKNGIFINFLVPDIVFLHFPGDRFGTLGN